MAPSTNRRATLPRLSRWYELFIAFRILRAQRRSFLSAVGLISALGVVFGVTSLTVILSVSGGFQSAIRDKVLGFYPHLVVVDRSRDFSDYRAVADRISEVPVVRGVSPATYDEMMVSNGERRAGVVVKGVDVSTVRSVSDLDEFLADGVTVDALDETPTLTRRDDGTVEAGRLIVGTATTVIAMADGRLVALPGDGSPPEPTRSRLRLIHAAPGVPAARLTLDGPAPEDTAPASVGTAAPWVDLEPGNRTFELRPATGGAPLASLSVPIAADRRYNIVVSPGPAGAVPTLTLLTEEVPTPPVDKALVRLLNAVPGGQPLLLDAPGAPADEAIAPLALSVWRTADGRLPGILLASDLARRIRAKRGDELTVVSPLRGLGSKMIAPFGMAPTAGRFRVEGEFRVGYYEYDTRFVVINFEAAKRFLNRGDVPQWLEVRVEDAERVADLSDQVKAAIDPYDIETFLEFVSGARSSVREVVAGNIPGYAPVEPRDALDVLGNLSAVLGVMRYQDLQFGYRDRFKLTDWETTYQYLFVSLNLQKVVLAIFFLIIVLVASFNIIGSQVMVVHEKQRAISILRSMGARAGAIRRIFLLQGMVIGVIGTSVGLLTGVGTCFLVDWVGIGLDPKVYYISKLPIDMDPLEFALTGVAALVFSFLASRYSANKAANRPPVEGLRRLD